MSKIKLKSIEDCNELIGKRVLYKYHDRLRTGIVDGFEQEGSRIYFHIKSDMAKGGITHINMFKLIELTDRVIK